MGISKFNASGYYDPTPYYALKNIDKNAKSHKHGRGNQRNNQRNAPRKPVIQNGQPSKTGNQNKNQRTHPSQIILPKREAVNPQPSKVVYICSPLRGDMERNIKNACSFCRFAVAKGFIPLAAHLMFPRFMDDGDAEEREAALFMGVRLLAKCDEVWCFGPQISEGMASELAVARELNKRIRAFNERMEEV